MEGSTLASAIEPTGPSPWHYQLTISTFGVVARLRCDRPFPERLLSALPPSAIPVASDSADMVYSLSFTPPEHRISLDDQELGRSSDLESLLEALEGDLRLRIAARSDTALFIHAGVVGWRSRVIVIPGRSFSGKSTLVSALIRAGASYYSDEYAVLDTRGQVAPFPQPISIRVPGQHSPARVDAAALGGTVGKETLPVGMVVATRHRAGETFEPMPLSNGGAILALFDNTVAAQRLGARAIPILRRSVEGACGWQGLRGEADVAARAILTRAVWE